MKRLFVFQGIRMCNNRILFLLPLLLIIIIGISGIFLGYLYGGSDATPKTRLLFLYNAYLQFAFLFLLYVFISTFAKDFSNGTYTYTVSYTHLRAHETDSYLVCRLLLEKKKQ